jgi:hypothetical protein
MDNGNRTFGEDLEGAGKEAAAQSRTRVITYLAYALDDVSALSPMALHLLEMAITILTEEPQGADEETTPFHRPS